MLDVLPEVTSGAADFLCGGSKVGMPFQVFCNADAKKKRVAVNVFKEFVIEAVVAICLVFDTKNVTLLCVELHATVLHQFFKLSEVTW